MTFWGQPVFFGWQKRGQIALLKDAGYIVVMEWRPSRSTLRGETAPTGKEASEEAQGGGIRGLQKGRGCVLLHRQVVFLNQVLE